MSMQHARYELLFLVLAINFDQFQILWGITDVQTSKLQLVAVKNPCQFKPHRKNSWIPDMWFFSVPPPPRPIPNHKFQTKDLSVLTKYGAGFVTIATYSHWAKSITHFLVECDAEGREIQLYGFFLLTWYFQMWVVSMLWLRIVVWLWSYTTQSGCSFEHSCCQTLHSFPPSLFSFPSLSLPSYLFIFSLLLPFFSYSSCSPFCLFSLSSFLFSLLLPSFTFYLLSSLSALLLPPPPRVVQPVILLKLFPRCSPPPPPPPPPPPHLTHHLH